MSKRVFVLHPCTNFESHGPSRSEDMADFQSRHLSDWWPWPLTFWSWSWCGMYAVTRTTFLPFFVFLWIFVVDLWANMNQTNYTCRYDPDFWSLYGVPGHMCHGFLPANFQLATPFRSRPMVRQRTNRPTDRRRPWCRQLAQQSGGAQHC